MPVRKSSKFVGLLQMAWCDGNSRFPEVSWVDQKEYKLFTSFSVVLNAFLRLSLIHSRRFYLIIRTSSASPSVFVSIYCSGGSWSSIPIARMNSHTTDSSRQITKRLRSTGKYPLSLLRWKKVKHCCHL